MNRQFNKPIRTYGGKKLKEVIIPIPKIVNLTASDGDSKNRLSLNKKSNTNEKTEFDDNSMHYDPFDTTFDRLVKNARLPPPAPKVHNDTASFNSTSDSLIRNINKSETGNPSLNESSNFNMKPISKQGATCKKLKVQITKKTIAKNKKSVLQISGKFKLQKNDSRPEYKAYKTRNKKKTISDKSDIDFLNLTSDVKVSEGKTHKRAKRKASNKKNFAKRRKKNNTTEGEQSLNTVEIKPCFVSLDKSSISKWNSKLHVIEDNLSNEASTCAININTSSDQHRTVEMSVNDSNRNKTSINHCFVNVEQLEISSFIKPLKFDKRYENVVSSTPNGRPIRPSTHLIALSPIGTGHRNKISVNENRKASLELTQINDSLCTRSDVIEKCKTMEKPKMVVSYLTNLSDASKCNLSESEYVNKKNIDSQYMSTYNANGTCSETRVSVQKQPVKNNLENETEILVKEELVKNNLENENAVLVKEELVKNNLKSETENCAMLLQKHANPDTVKKKQHLSFAVDVNRSQSLFNDSNESIENLSHKDSVRKSETKLSTSNSELHTRNELLSNETSFDAIKLRRKSTLSTYTNRRATFDETQKDASKIIDPSSLTTRRLDASSDDVENNTEAREADHKNGDTSNVIEQRLTDESHTLNIDNSFMGNIKKYSTEPPYVALKQLQDPVRITKRRKYTKWDLDLYSIAEDSNSSTVMKREKTGLERITRGRQTILPRKTLMSLENIPDECINNAIEQPIYLKPGKSWARSLSILNNVQNESNLDKLSIGKGKKWRHSVQDILNMQKQGIIHSCIKRNDNEKELQLYDETINKSEHELVNNRSRTCDSTNLGRISRRISVRVVPIHKTVKSIEDAPFLEVYGIVPVKNQRFTLLNNPRKSSTCNVHADDSDGQIIIEPVVSAAKEVILQRCLQTDYIPFSTYFSDSYLEYCRKIGEGVYGEVFLYEENNAKSVIKIIPIEGSECVNGEPQKKFHEILSEIVIAMELHNLRFNTRYNTDGFVEVKNIKCIKGRYPEKLIELWNIYDEERRSDNDCPSMFDDDQLYIVLELGHGGQDLEAFVFNTAEEAHILFVQAALALAVAEKAVQFEHRDLHWGNILISLTNDSYVHYKLGQKNIALISKGVKVSIIDFTLSRVTYQGCSVFNDLASDPTLFTAQGEYQFEIYRLMKDKVKNSWQRFEPYTNILWLHYTLDKMITAVRYRRKNLKIHKHGIAKLTVLKNEILAYSSAFDFVTNCDKIVNLLCINSKSEITLV